MLELGCTTTPGDKRSAFPVEYGDNVEGTGFSRSELDPPGQQRLENLTALAPSVLQANLLLAEATGEVVGGGRVEAHWNLPRTRSTRPVGILHWDSDGGIGRLGRDASPLFESIWPLPPSATGRIPGIRSGPETFFF